MKRVPFDENRIDTEVYERVEAEGELVLREVAKPTSVLRAPLENDTLLLATERSSIHRKLLAIFG
jgi:hypothetical protein